MVQTERLILQPCTPQVARAAVRSGLHAESVLGMRVHMDWPGQDIRGYLPVYARQVETDPEWLRWGVWLVIHAAERMVIGDTGFKGKPGASGTIDLGYGLVYGYRRQGYGFEAACGMRDWAFAQPEVRRMTADCWPDNLGSARILEKLGMRRLGLSTAGLLMWEMVKGQE